MTNTKTEVQKNEDAIILAFNEVAKKHGITPTEIIQIFINKIEDSSAISDLQKVVNNRLDSIKAEVLSRYIQEGKKMASALGIDPQAIVDGLTSTRAKNQQVEPKYRSKTNEKDTWSGRGKQPRWLVTELENGAKLEDFLI